MNFPFNKVKNKETADKIITSLLQTAMDRFRNIVTVIFRQKGFASCFLYWLRKQILLRALHLLVCLSVSCGHRVDLHGTGTQHLQ
jgi:hypothetical protein